MGPNPQAREQVLPQFAPPQQVHTNRTYSVDLLATSKRAQELDPPLFIPALTRLRRSCFQHLTSSLCVLENSIGNGVPESADGRQKVAQSIQLMQQLDSIIDSEIRRMQFENPDYAATHGLDIIHFEQHEGANHGREGAWTMLSKVFGPQSRSVITVVADDKTARKNVSAYHQSQVKNFMQVNDFSQLRTWRHRFKNSAEKRSSTIKYEVDGSVRINVKIKWLWHALALFSIIALVLFYGVGIIATNTTFTHTFQRLFFGVAIAWSLVSSLWLAIFVAWLGASKRDAVGAFLTGLGLWLVVIQIGQTHLITQLSQNQGS